MVKMAMTTKVSMRVKDFILRGTQYDPEDFDRAQPRSFAEGSFYSIWVKFIVFVISSETEIRVEVGEYPAA